MTTQKVLQLTDSNFPSEVIGSKRPVLVDFWAAWCGPCRLLTPTIEQLAAQFDGSVTVGKLNVDENPETAARYGISSIPTVLVFENGHVVEQLVGLQSKEQYEKVLTNVLGEAAEAASL